MNYTIATRARRNGLYFERHELEPLGIREDSTCWGLWIEGRGFDEASRLDDEEHWLRNETPHLVISPIRPDLWPTAFNLQVLLQRRQTEAGKPPEQCDAFYGLSDALARSGVDILLVRTAQVGYDLISVHATCEMPRLRAAVLHLLKASDSAAYEMEKFRARTKHPLTPAEQAERKAIDDRVHHHRIEAFQSLGLLMMPRLAELEARLLAIDHYRHCYWKLGKGLFPADRRSQMERSMLQRHYEVLVGEPPGKTSGADQLEEVRESLSAAWFLNSKVVEVGENSYFLAYDSLRKPAATLSSRARHLDPQHLVADNAELDARERNELWRSTYMTLLNREVSDSLRPVIPKTRGTGRGSKTFEARSATAERMQEITNPHEFEGISYREFFQRQALIPIRISALPTLAYARFWAFGGAAERGKPIALRYRHNLLRPDLASVKAGRLEELFRFLNGTTRCRGDAARGEFGPQMAVLVSMNLRDRFMRLRFARELAEPRAYVTVKLHYQVKRLKGSDTRGLLRSLTGLILRKNLRIERCSNVVLENDDELERGVLDVVAKAASRAGEEECCRVADLARKDRQALATAWMQELIACPSAGARWAGDQLNMEIVSGFAPPER